MSLRCLRSLFCAFEMFKKSGQCLWDVWDKLFCVCLRCFFEMFAESENWRPIPTIARIRYAKDVGKRKNWQRGIRRITCSIKRSARPNKCIWQTTWQGKGNNLRTSRRKNHSTQHDCKNLKRHIEKSRHGGRKEKQGRRRERLIRKTCRRPATSDSAELNLMHNQKRFKHAQRKPKQKLWRTTWHGKGNNPKTNQPENH